MLFQTCLVTILFCIFTVQCVPVQTNMEHEDDRFFLKLDPSEQSALMEIMVESSRIVAAQRSSGTFLANVKLNIPESLKQNFQDQPEFRRNVLRWIGRRWDLVEQALVDLELKGSGCNPRVCLSITNSRSNSDVCCPFGK